MSEKRKNALDNAENAENPGKRYRNGLRRVRTCEDDFREEWANDYNVPEICKTDVTVRCDTDDYDRSVKVAVLTLAQQARQDRWKEPDYIREILQNFLDACKRTALDNSCDMTALQVAMEYDKEQDRISYIVTAGVRNPRSNHLDVLAGAAVEGKGSENKQNRMLVGVMTVEPYNPALHGDSKTLPSRDRISISTFNPAQVMNKSCLNIGQSTKSDKGMTPEHVDARLLPSGFFGDGMKVGLLAHLRNASPSRQPHHTIFSNNERLQFGIVGHKDHRLSQETSEVKFEPHQQGCLMYLHNIHPTGNIVIVRIDDVNRSAFSERAFLFLAEPTRLNQFTIQPSLFKITYFRDGTVRPANPEKKREVQGDTDADSEEETKDNSVVPMSKVTNGGSIVIFRDPCPWLLLNDKGLPEVDDKAADDKADVLGRISDSTYVRCLMLTPANTASICRRPGAGMMFKSGKHRFLPMQLESAFCIFDAYNLLANPAGVERQHNGLSPEELYWHIFRWLPPMPQKISPETETWTPLPLYDKFRSSSRYTCYLPPHASPSETCRFIYEQLFQWLNAWDLLTIKSEMERLDAAGTMCPKIRVTSKLSDKTQKWLQFQHLTLGSHKAMPLELQVLSSYCMHKESIIGDAFGSLFRHYYKGKKKLPYPVEHNASRAMMTGYTMFTGGQYELVGCGPMLLRFLRLQQRDNSHFLDLHSLEQEKVSLLPRYVPKSREEKDAREIEKNLRATYGDLIGDISYFQPEVSTGNFVIVVTAAGIHNLKLDSSLLNIDVVHATKPCKLTESGHCVCQFTAIVDVLEDLNVTPNVSEMTRRGVFGGKTVRGDAEGRAAKEKKKIEKKQLALLGANSKTIKAMQEKQRQQELEAKERSEKLKRKEQKKKLKKEQALKAQQEKKAAESKVVIPAASAPKEVTKASSADYFHAKPINGSTGKTIILTMGMSAGGGACELNDAATKLTCFPSVGDHLITHASDTITPVSDQGCLTFALTDSSHKTWVEIVPTEPVTGQYQIFTLMQAFEELWQDGAMFSLALPGFSFHLLESELVCDNDILAIPVTHKIWSNTSETGARSKLGISLHTQANSNPRSLLNLRILYKVAVPSAFFDLSDPLSSDLEFLVSNFALSGLPRQPLLDSIASMWQMILPTMFGTLKQRQPNLVVPDSRRNANTCHLADLRLLFRAGFSDEAEIKPSDYPLPSGASISDQAQAIANFMLDMKGVCRHRSQLLALVLLSQSIQCKVAHSPLHEFLCVYSPKHNCWFRLDAGGGGSIVPAQDNQTQTDSNGSGSGSFSFSADKGKDKNAQAKEKAIQEQWKRELHIFAYRKKYAFGAQQSLTENKEKEGKEEKEKAESSETVVDVEAILTSLLLSSQAGGSLSSPPTEVAKMLSEYPKGVTFLAEWFGRKLREQH